MPATSIESLLHDVQAYIGSHIRPGETPGPPARKAPGPLMHGFITPPSQGAGLMPSIAGSLEDSFSSLLLKFIKAKAMSNSEVYKEANIDRRLFSKIISSSSYAPARSTAIALSIALRLDTAEAAQLLGSAGFALSHSSMADLVVEYFMKKGGPEYNIYTINDVLESLGLPQLGSKSWQG